MNVRTAEMATKVSGPAQPIDLSLTNIKFTATPYIHPQQVKESVNNQYKTLRNKEVLSKEEVEEFQRLIEFLSIESGEYEEGLFKWRKVKSRYRKQQIPKQPEKQIENLEDYLIDKEIAEFNNIGALGRKWVVNRLNEERIYKTPDHEIEKELQHHIQVLKEHLSLLNQQQTKEGWVNQLSELGITFKGDGIAARVAECFLEEDQTNWTTLSQLKNWIDKIIADIKEKGIVDSTFEGETFEQFYKQG
ncbi:hypothetical protein [Halobacillus karajensis]|uniref:Uncharacterized protein n=1 Tax=Halobacillus karajensis TaxID=195088 RepID=A0A059NZ25_9BACI|nr:hypothetical protein [Halobacillus karajensis]CDQ18929.1 hypothetical protein BN982_01210 [Halobacillus karajensis]CDQ22998.1 hypothetical protein BN983_01217 [Halobacillus karajensis]CDQ26480.1 hypothetical protein BN981_00697 [Halobacillus karajensis]